MMHYGNAQNGDGGPLDATLNIRINAPLKERGDKVLREHGMSASAAVRALWQELATTRKLPEFLEKAADNSSEKRAKLLALDSLTGIAQGELSNMSDEELEAVGMARYE